MADNNSFIIDFSKAKETIKNNKTTLTILNLDKQTDMAEACRYDTEKLEYIYNFANKLAPSTLEELGFKGINLSFIPDDITLPLQEITAVRYAFTDGGYKYILAIAFEEKDEDEEEEENEEEGDAAEDKDDAAPDEVYELEGGIDVSFTCYAYINRAHMLEDGTFARDGIVEEYDFKAGKWQDAHFSTDMFVIPENDEEDEDDEEEDEPVYTEEQIAMIMSAYANGQTSVARFMAMMFDASFQEKPADTNDIDKLIKKYNKLIGICDYAGGVVEWGITNSAPALCASSDDRDGLLISQDGDYLVMSQLEMTYSDDTYTREVYRTKNSQTMLQVALPMLLAYAPMSGTVFTVPLSKNAWMEVVPSFMDDEPGLSVMQHKAGPDKELTPDEASNAESYVNMLKERVSRASRVLTELTPDKDGEKKD